MKNLKNDWRFTNQDKYLRNIIFSYKHYNQPYPEHSHCEFCWIKFGAGGEIQEGYANPSDDRWICSQCFEDFRENLLGEWGCKIDKDNEGNK